MKRIFQFLAVGIFLVGFSACQKSYTCTCTYLENNQLQKVTYQLSSSTRNDAGNNCDNKAFSLSGKESVSCNIGK